VQHSAAAPASGLTQFICRQQKIYAGCQFLLSFSAPTLLLYVVYCAGVTSVRINMQERQVHPDRELVDVLGYAAPAFATTILQSLTDCIKVLSVEGRIIFVNQIGLDELMGGSLDEVRDTVWTAYWPEIARPTLEEALALCAGGRHLTCEVPRPTDDGQDRLWQVNLSPIIDSRGDLNGILVMSRDLTANANSAPHLMAGE
jgi:PAS domain S-box-containing protein